MGGHISSHNTHSPKKTEKGVVFADSGRTVAGVEGMSTLCSASGPPMGQSNRKLGDKEGAVPTGQHPHAKVQQRRGMTGCEGQMENQEPPPPQN